MEYFIVFPDEDNFGRIQKGNQRNDVSTVMHIRTPADLMIGKLIATREMACILTSFLRA